MSSCVHSRMTISKEELRNIVAQLTEDKQLYVTVRESLKGGCTAAITTTVGRLLLGPVGLLVGGAVGGIVAYHMSKDKFKSLPEIIDEMTDDEYKRLAASVTAVFAELGVQDYFKMIEMVKNIPSAAEAALNVVTAFIQDEKKLSIVEKC